MEFVGESQPLIQGEDFSLYLIPTGDIAME